MLDVLLRSKFYSKCKTAMKMTKMRIEMIKRKRSAMEKFLKKDIVDLLKNGLDINAYGRAGGLLVEYNMSACYNLVTQFCVCLSHQVSKMDKQSVCPEECREAVSSLMYAAARFADLPELRELRAIFVEKYGNSLEANVNHEFVEKLKATPPTKEMKIRLLQDMATKSGKSWDSKALEQKLYIPPPSDQALCTNEENHTIPEKKNEPIEKITKKDTEDNTRKSSLSPPRRVKDLTSYRTKKNEDRDKLQVNKNSAVHGGDSKIVLTSLRESKYVDDSNLKNDRKQVELEEEKSFHRKIAPLPYNKSSAEGKYEPQINGNNIKHGGEFEKATNSEIYGISLYEDEHQNKPRSRNNGNEGKIDEIRNYPIKFAQVSYQENLEKTSSRDYRVANFEQKEKPDDIKHFERKFAPPAPYTLPKAETSLAQEKIHKQDDLIYHAKPKPRSVRSVRSIRSIIPPDDANITKNNDVLYAIRQELGTRPGHKSLNNRKEADEKDINDILMHYCKKEFPHSGK